MLSNDSVQIAKENHRVSGMTCASCARGMESSISKWEGIHKVVVNYPNQSVSLEYDKTKISIETIQNKTKKIGYEIITRETQGAEKVFGKLEEKRLTTLQSKLIFSAIFSVPIFIMSMFFMGKIPFENWIMMILSVPALFWGGSQFFVIAWKKMKHFSANMDTLVALSTGIAFLFSVFNTIYPQYFLNKGVTPLVYYESAVIIITLILLGKYLEERAKSKTSAAITKLMGLKPKQVTVIRNAEEQVISFDEIIKGDLIVLKPGDKVPIDGKVKKGTSFIDESMISGEPFPVCKTKGDAVFSGTLNQKGSLTIIANKVGEDTLLSQIIKLVEHAQATKPAIQKLVDKVAGIFVPIVMGISILTFFIWYLFGPQPSFTYALLALITVLIIACPCALGLATPTALMVGMGKGAEQGILIKDAQSLETAYKIDTLIIDKTGTITEGKPKVTDFVWNEKNPSFEFNKVLLAMESLSEHPLAQAIVQHLKKEEIEPIQTDSFESITAMGVKAQYEMNSYIVGNKRLMEENKTIIPEELCQKAEKLKQEAKTVVYFGVSNEVKAIIAISDKIKENSIVAIKKIQNMGIDIHMLTGDNEQTASVVAKQVGIKHFKANTMPSDKGGFVKELQNKGKIVAMAGDGINDSLALAQSNVGIAMGNGTDIAIESASITLMYSDLIQITKAIKLSKATMKTIRQNLFWAFIYNLIALPIAAGVLYPLFDFLLNPMIAGAAMTMSSISVLTNSIRLKNRTII